MTPRTVLAIALCALALLLPSLASAATSNLRVVVIPSGAIPGNFGDSHVKVFTHFKPSLTVNTTVGGVQVKSACTLPTSIQSGWNQGLIQAFDRPLATLALQVCASHYADTASAHAAYATLVKTQITPRLNMNLAGKVDMTTIGNESTGLTTAGHACPCGQVGSATYELLFRRNSTIVDLTYTGPDGYSITKFEAVARGSDAKLRK